MLLLLTARRISSFLYYNTTFGGNLPSVDTPARKECRANRILEARASSSAFIFAGRRRALAFSALNSRRA